LPDTLLDTTDAEESIVCGLAAVAIPTFERGSHRTLAISFSVVRLHPPILVLLAYASNLSMEKGKSIVAAAASGSAAPTTVYGGGTMGTAAPVVPPIPHVTVMPPITSDATQ